MPPILARWIHGWVVLLKASFIMLLAMIPLKILGLALEYSKGMLIPTIAMIFAIILIPYLSLIASIAVKFTANSYPPGGFVGILNNHGAFENLIGASSTEPNKG